jgi:cation diffusion facilitator CzcD-associated flavoprotein CzcO
MPQDNPPYSEEDKRKFRADPTVLEHLHEEISRMFSEGFSNAVVDAESPVMKALQEACERNLEENVRDPELKKKLTPDYRAACKRLIVSPDFYQAIQRPNAELVTEGIERIEPAGVRTRDGRLHELDVLVLATGFNAHQFMRPMQVRGRGGVSLDELWSVSPSAYLSVSVPGFPNFFMLNGPNGPVGNFSLIEVAELQLAYILQLVAPIRAGECRHVAAREDATERFNRARVEAAKKTIWMTGCRSWYLDPNGIPATWPWPFTRFQEKMRAPDFEDFDLAT